MCCCQRVQLADELSCVTDQVIEIVENREVGGQRQEEKEGCDSTLTGSAECLRAWLRCEMGIAHVCLAVPLSS